MILSKRVALGGQQLDELHERIVIRSVDPGVPHENIESVNRMGGSGQRITGAHWETLDVTVGFAIDIPKYNMAERRAVFESVTAWALRKGWLTVNWLPNRRLYVDKVIIPNSGDLWDWTSEYTITFRAYNVPFWQDEQPTQAVSGTVSSGTLQLAVGGNMPSPLEITFRNRSGMTIDNFTVSAGGKTQQLTNLGLGGTATLQFRHGTDGLLRITAGGANVYGKMSGHDDIVVNPGNVSVSFSADRAGTFTVQSYGRWA